MVVCSALRKQKAWGGRGWEVGGNEPLHTILESCPFETLETGGISPLSGSQALRELQTQILFVCLCILLGYIGEYLGNNYLFEMREIQ